MRSWGLAGWLVASVVLGDASASANQGATPHARARLESRVEAALAAYRPLAKSADDDVAGCESDEPADDRDDGSACEAKLDEEQREAARLRRTFAHAQREGRDYARALGLVDRVMSSKASKALRAVDPDDDVDEAPAREELDDGNEPPDLDEARSLLEQARIRD